MLFKKIQVKRLFVYVLSFGVSIHFSDLFAQKESRQSTPDNCPAVSIKEFKLLNNNLPVDSLLRIKTITLSADENSFSISFAAVDTTAGNDVIYYYKLDGADKQWIKAGRSATVNYTLLPPGRYDFKITCNTHDPGIGNKAALHIVIKIPFWLSWWFIILGCMAFVGVAYYLHTQRIKRLMEVEAIRQKVSRDLHDDIGSTLSTINILSMMAKSRLAEDPVKASEYLGKISDNSSRMMEAMDDIVWSINPVNDSMQKVFVRMREFATEVLEPKEMKLHFQFAEEANHTALNMEQRRDIFLIFKEAVNNVAKYSRASEAECIVSVTNNIFLLVIKDNGVGFDVAAADKGNGLNNMQKRAEKLKAKFNITSGARSGTQVSVEFQIT
jgi:two-component sensor histidine kinase